MGSRMGSGDGGGWGEHGGGKIETTVLEPQEKIKYICFKKIKQSCISSQVFAQS